MFNSYDSDSSDYEPAILVMLCRACKHHLTLDNFKTKVNGGINRQCKRCCAINNERVKRTAKRCPCGKCTNKSMCKICTDPILVTARNMVNNAKTEDIKHNRYDRENHVDAEFCINLLNTHKKCVYSDCNVTLQVMSKAPNMATLERKCNSIGHTKDNCTICCYSCNSSKRNYAEETTSSR